MSIAQKFVCITHYLPIQLSTAIITKVCLYQYGAAHNTFPFEDKKTRK